MRGPFGDSSSFGKLIYITHFDIISRFQDLDSMIRDVDGWMKEKRNERVEDNNNIQ